MTNGFAEAPSAVPENVPLCGHLTTTLPRPHHLPQWLQPFRAQGQPSILLAHMLNRWQRLAQKTRPMRAKTRRISARKNPQKTAARGRKTGMPLAPQTEALRCFRRGIEHLDVGGREFLKCALEQWIMRAAEHQCVDVGKSLEVALHRRSRDVRLLPSFLHDWREQRRGHFAHPDLSVKLPDLRAKGV